MPETRKLDDKELIDMIEKLRRGKADSEEEEDSWVEILKENGLRGITDVIFHTPDTLEMTSEEILKTARERAKPILL